MIGQLNVDVTVNEIDGEAANAEAGQRRKTCKSGGNGGVCDE